MKKSTVAFLIATLTCSTAITAILLTRVNRKVINEEVSNPAPFLINETVEANDEIFGRHEKSIEGGFVGNKLASPRLLDDFNEEDLSLTKPKIGYQYVCTDQDSDGNDDHISIRYTAAINSLDVDSATWTRAMYKANGDVYSGLTEANKSVVTAYTGVSHNGAIMYATDVVDDLGNHPYNYFVIYALLDIPLEGYDKYYLDASLTLAKGECSVTSSVGAVEVDVQKGFSYERGTLSELFFSNNGDRTLSVKGDSGSNASEIVIPAYYNNGEGRYPVTEVEDGAFKDFNGLEYLEIPDVDIMGADIVSGTNAKLLLRGEEGDTSNWHDDWNSGDNPASWNYIGYHGEKDNLIYSISEDDNNNLFATVIGCPLIPENHDDDWDNDVYDYVVSDFMSIPTKVISNFCFYNSYETIDNITLPSSVEVIGDSAFRRLGILHIYGGTGVEVIGDYAFERCNCLQEVPNASGVKSIGDFAFSECGMLDGDVQFEVLESLGDYAFNNCVGLDVFYLPDTLAQVGDNAFNYVNALILCEASSKPSTWSNKFPGIAYDEYSFTVIWNYKYNSELEIYEEDGVEYTILELNNGQKQAIVNCYTAYSGDVVIPETVNGATVVAVKNQAFYYSGVISVVLPDTVTSVGAYAFASCYNLTSVDLGGVTALERGVFAYSSALENIVWDNLTTIKSHAFESYQKDELILPDSVTTIECAAFYGAENLQALFIPSSVTDIAGNIFLEDNTNELQYFNPQTVICCGGSNQPSGWAKHWNYGLPTFFNCYTEDGSIVLVERDDLEYDDDSQIVYYIENDEAHVYHYIGMDQYAGVPDLLGDKPVTSIDKYAFFGCSDVQYVYLPETTTSIGEGAFRFTNLYEIHGADFVTSVGDFAFDHLYNLTRNTFAEGLAYIGDYAFNCCSAIQTMDYIWIVSIGECAFNNCTGLQYLFIPETLTFVGENAFHNTSVIFLCQAESQPVDWDEDFLGNKEILESRYFVWGSGGWFPDYMDDDDGIRYLIAGLYVEEDEDDEYVAIIVSNRYTSGDIVIPETITVYGWDEATVVAVNDNAFYDNSGMTSIELPETVTFAGKSAFSYCCDLESIDLGSVEILQANIFCGSYCLRSINWSNNLRAIKEFAFKDTGLTELVIPNTVTELGRGVFYMMANIETIYIPASVTYMPYNIFVEEEGMVPDAPAELVIYCGAANRPQGWAKHWNSGLPTLWGCSLPNND